MCHFFRCGLNDSVTLSKDEEEKPQEQGKEITDKPLYFTRFHYRKGNYSIAGRSGTIIAYLNE